MSYRLDPQWEDHDIEPDYSSSRWRGHLYKALISVGVLTAFGAAVLYAYSEGAPAGDKVAKTGAVPLVKAEVTPVKEKPEDPGGVKVPHRNRDIYRKLDIGNRKAETTDPAAKPVKRQAQVPPRPQTYEDILAPKGTAKSHARPSPKPDRDDKKTAAADAEVKRVAVTPTARDPQTRDRQPRDARTDADAPQGKIAMVPRLRGRPVSDDASERRRDRQVAEIAPRSGPRAVPKARPDTRDRTRRRTDDSTRDRARVQTASAVGPYRIQLGAFRSSNKAQYEWRTLTRRNKDVLGSLRMVIEKVNLGSKGVYYRLQAGPLKTAPAARGLCRTLGKRKVDCILVNG